MAALGAGFFLLAAMFAIAIVLPLWLAGLVIAALSLIIGFSALSVGRRRLKAVIRRGPIA